VENISTRTQIHARLPTNLIADVDANARELGVDRTAVIQTALAKYLEQPEHIPIQLRYASLEQRIYDLELIVRSRPKQKTRSELRRTDGKQT
jgi:antitoxin component of RelBE/YafQ-DinJ toxin-antitoxin module